MPEQSLGRRLQLENDKLMGKKPDIQVRFRVSYEVDVPIHSCHSPELYEQKVKADAKQVRLNILHYLFGQGYESRPIEPVNEENVRIEFIKFLQEIEKDYSQELLPPKEPEIVTLYMKESDG